MTHSIQGTLTSNQEITLTLPGNQEIILTLYQKDLKKIRTERLEAINNEVVMIKELMQDIHGLIEDQSPPLDQIEDTVVASKEKVVEGQKDLVKAEKYKGLHRKVATTFTLLTIGTVSGSLWVLIGAKAAIIAGSACSCIFTAKALS
jgi:hypothetical protein